MELSFFGVSYIADDIAPETEEAIRTEAKKLRAEAEEKFIQFLDNNNLEDVMGFIKNKEAIQ